MSNLPKVVTQRCLEWDLNPRPTDSKSNAHPLQYSVNLASIDGSCCNDGRREGLRPSPVNGLDSPLDWLTLTIPANAAVLTSRPDIV